MTVFGSRDLLLCFNSFLFLLPGIVSAESVIATVGEDVTIICKYDATYYGKLYACWGRGAIPNNGCANEVIKSDGTSVVSRPSDRYLLLGNVDGGDVSLTIKKVNESDSGMYGCRVEIPGWFNDHKHETTLTVVAARPYPLKIETREVKARAVTVRWTLEFDGGKPVTNYRIDLKFRQASWDTAVSTEVSNPELTQLTLVDLRPAKSYNLRMFATNPVGMSEASNVLTVTTKEAAPEGPPLDMTLESLTSTSIKVTWKPPHPDLRNGVLQSYSISYREYDTASGLYKGWQHLSVIATRDLESATLRNLRPSTKYDILIKAKTKAGIGPTSVAPLFSTLDEASTASTGTSTSTASTVWTWDTGFTSVLPSSMVEPVTAATVRAETTNITSVPPDPPVLELKEVKGNTISLSWAPGFEGDSPITGYYLEYKAVNASWDYTTIIADVGPDQTKVTVIELNPSTYNIRMFARSSLGTSAASNVLTITTGDTGHQMDNLISTESTDNHVAESVKDSQGGHLVAIMVPVVLVMLVVAILVSWQFQRIKQKHGSLYMWLNSRVLRYSGTESLQEL